MKSTIKRMVDRPKDATKKKLLRRFGRPETNRGRKVILGQPLDLETWREVEIREPRHGEGGSRDHRPIIDMGAPVSPEPETPSSKLTIIRCFVSTFPH
jgi:hypothetical protein